MESISSIMDRMDLGVGNSELTAALKEVETLRLMLDLQSQIAEQKINKLKAENDRLTKALDLRG
jgi:cell shape-determining protein MreC